MTRGQETTHLGERLTHKLKEVDDSLIVYVGHGKRSTSKKVQTFMSEKINNGTRIADIDIMISKPNGDILFLVEIEESSAAPKTILGDVFSILFCDGVQADNKKFKPSPQTEVIIGTHYNSDGDKASQFELIKKRIEFFTNRVGSLNVSSIRFIYEDSLCKAISTIEKIIIKEITELKNS